ncbi:MAG: sigma-70 family RNA polymerase sigma factor [Cyanobacteriota bacterium]|nr:sigma-70 family RNA polymerase sigma factor [Cyanobacteriota bacterium]
MQIPSFPESNHPIVKALFHYSDQELLTLYQRHPEEGKYFTAIFCRYSQIVYTLIRHSAKSPVQADYLFALIWRHIFYELKSLDLRKSAAAQSQTAEGEPVDDGHLTLQNWLINVTALCINQAEMPPVESIRYSIEAAPPPFWSYLQQALDMLDPLQRAIVLMAQTFHWSESRISAYLQAEGDNISPVEVGKQLPSAYDALEAALPEDIRTIYLEEYPARSEDSGEMPELDRSLPMTNS